MKIESSKKKKKENRIILYTSLFLTLTPNLSASHLHIQNMFRK